MNNANNDGQIYLVVDGRKISPSDLTPSERLKLYENVNKVFRPDLTPDRQDKPTKIEPIDVVDFYREIEFPEHYRDDQLRLKLNEVISHLNERNE